MNQRTDVALRALAEAYGVHAGFFDLQGQHRPAAPPTLRALLGAMGVDASSDAAVADALAARQSEDAARALPREVVIASGRAAELPLARPVEWSLTDETGAEIAAGQGAASVVLPPLDFGYYDLHLGGETTPCFLICRPDHAPLVDEQIGAGRAWGFCGALYGMRSDHNGGLGSYKDLGEALSGLARTGAQFLGLNPVHALGWAADDTMNKHEKKRKKIK